MSRVFLVDKRRCGIERWVWGASHYCKTSLFARWCDFRHTTVAGGTHSLLSLCGQSDDWDSSGAQPPASGCIRCRTCVNCWLFKFLYYGNVGGSSALSKRTFDFYSIDALECCADREKKKII